MSDLMLALMPVLVLLACRALCTSAPAPVPTYLDEKKTRPHTSGRF